jgi:hypothetical protein
LTRRFCGARGAFPAMAQSPASGLSEAECALALERFELLRPALAERVPLARVARDRGLALRTARRWAARYQREGLAGLVRKGRSGGYPVNPATRPTRAKRQPPAGWAGGRRGLRAGGYTSPRRPAR